MLSDIAAMRLAVVVPQAVRGLSKVCGSGRFVSSLAYQRFFFQSEERLPLRLKQTACKPFRNLTASASTSTGPLVFSNGLINRDRVILFSLGRYRRPISHRLIHLNYE